MRILGIGTTVIDQVVVLDSYPMADTKNPITDSWVQVGGPVPVALSTATELGAKTRLLSRWGQDSEGQLIQNTLQERTIDIRYVRTQDDWKSGQAQVWVSQQQGTRTIAFSRGAFPVLQPSDISASLLDDCRILHLDGWSAEAAVYAAQQMKARQGIVVLDAGSMKPGLQELLPFVDILVASDLFRNACQARTGSEFPSAVPTVVCTDGANGATLISKEGRFRVRGKPVNVIDSNGAGDIFCGALLFALTLNKPLPECVEFANEHAAQSCTQRGNSLIAE